MAILCYKKSDEKIERVPNDYNDDVLAVLSLEESLAADYGDGNVVRENGVYKVFTSCGQIRGIFINTEEHNPAIADLDAIAAFDFPNSLLGLPIENAGDTFESLLADDETPVQHPRDAANDQACNEKWYNGF